MRMSHNTNKAPFFFLQAVMEDCFAGSNGGLLPVAVSRKRYVKIDSHS